MEKTNRIVAVFFGALLIVAFFLPWLEYLKILDKSITSTGYEIILKPTLLETVLKEVTPVTYFFLLFPITGALAVVFSGIIRAPYLPLLSAMSSIAYVTFFIAQVGWDRIKNYAGYYGLGLWISLACLLVIFVNTSLQAATKDKKKGSKH